MSHLRGVWFICGGLSPRLFLDTLVKFFFSEPIDVASLIGCGTPTSDETPLFDDSEKQAVVKSEPPEEVEEWEQEEMRLPPPKEREVPEEEAREQAPPRAGQPLVGQGQAQPSLATALNSISSNDSAKTRVVSCRLFLWFSVR